MFSQFKEKVGKIKVDNCIYLANVRKVLNLQFSNKAMNTWISLYLNNQNS